MTLHMPLKRIASSHTLQRARQLSLNSARMASSFPPTSIRDLASEVSLLLKQRSETVCVAETVWSRHSN